MSAQYVVKEPAVVSPEEIRAIPVHWIEADSSNVVRYGWSPNGHVLVVEFKGGAVYNYFDVPESVFMDMQGALSVGKFLARAIKGVYEYGQVL